MRQTLARALKTCRSCNPRERAFPAACDPFSCPRRRILFWLGLSLLLLGFAFAVDAPVSHLLKLGPSNFSRHLAGYSSKAGEGWVVALIGAVCCIWLFWRGRL